MKGKTQTDKKVEAKKPTPKQQEAGIGDLDWGSIEATFASS